MIRSSAYTDLTDGWALSSRARLRDHVALNLAREIVSGRLRLGESLPAEATLAEGLGVSKLAIREALQAMAAVGMVHIQHGKRTIVLGDESWDMLGTVVQLALRLEGRAKQLTNQLYEARILIESDATALAAERRSDEEAQSIQDLATKMRGISVGSQSVPEFLLLDAAFHDRVASASRNAFLRSFVRKLHSVIGAGWWLGSAVTPEQLNFISTQHMKIAAAIQERAPRRARAAMREHLMWAQENDTSHGEFFQPVPEPF